MKRRIFITGGSAAVVTALAGCGGGGGGGTGLADVATGVVNTSTNLNPTMPSPTPAGGTGYAFGSRLQAYAAGILPTNVSTATMDAAVKRCYDAWKAQAIADVPSVPGGKAVRFGTSPTYLTVSEGMGYGMLITVVMAGHDPQARAIFDGLLKTVRSRPAYSIPASSGGAYLMDWRLAIDGSSTDAAGGGWNAMDGDLDIAMALLMADRQWGSTTTWNYHQEAVNTINALKSWNMKPDGTTKGMATPDVSRTSDYMIGHFRAFARATGDSYWSTTVIDRCWWLINRMQTVYSPSAGLMPDFIVQTNTATPSPSPGYMGDFVATEMHYYANAQRNPWRWGTDYVLSGDVRWKDVCNKMMAFFKADNGGDPTRTATGYALDGSLPGPLFRPYPNWVPRSMTGPQLCGAMVDPAHQGYLNTLFSYNSNNFSTLYYDSELQLIPLLVASGNWWTP